MKFSVLIPAYKEKFLDECISSCISQTYDDYEIIIIDDQSPYNLASIVDKFKDSHIHFYRNERGYGAEHIVDNWNHCLKFATGEYVMCIGDDDKLKPNCLQNYISLISKYPNLDVYHCRMEIIDEQSMVTTIQEDRPETETAFSMIWHFWHGRRQVLGDWLFRTTSLKEKGGFFFLPYGWSSDNITAFELAAEKGVANTKEVGFQYRESSLAITSNNTTEATLYKIDAWKKARIWYSDFLLKNEPHDEIDKIYKSDIEKLFQRYFDRKIIGELTLGIKKSPLSLFKWLRLSNKICVSKKQRLANKESYIVSKIYHINTNDMWRKEALTKMV